MKYLVLALFLVIVGCAASKGHLNTPSGGPEVIIRNVTEAQVKDACLTWCSKHGFRIDDQTNNSITANTSHYLDDGQHVLTIYQIIDLTFNKENSDIHLFGELHKFAPDTVGTQEQREWMMGELRKIDETLTYPNGR